MDIISAYREAGTYRGAAVISGTTHKTVKRVIARHEAGGAAPERGRRATPAPALSDHRDQRCSTDVPARHRSR